MCIPSLHHTRIIHIQFKHNAHAYMHIMYYEIGIDILIIDCNFFNFFLQWNLLFWQITHFSKIG